MDLRVAVEDLNRMILSGQAMEAFEKYYHEDCAMAEGSAEPTVGKDANRKREEDFFGAVTEFRGAEVHGVAVGDDLTMVEWTFDYTHRDWGDQNYRQVAVQRWKDSQIIEERFFRAG